MHIPRPIPDLESQNLWGQGLRIYRLISLPGRDSVNRELSVLCSISTKAQEAKTKFPKCQQTLPIMLEPNLGDGMGTGLLRKETGLPNLVTRRVNVKSTRSMAMSSRREKKWLRDSEGCRRWTDSTQWPCTWVGSRDLTLDKPRAAAV